MKKAIARIKPGTRMLCVYRDRKNQVTERVVQVKEVEIVGNRTKLLVWDYDKSAYRTFYRDKLDKVVTVNMG